MALIKAKDMAYGRLRSPDLDVMEEFLTRFGMARAARTPTALYMRGTDPEHHIHVTEKGDPKFLGFAYYAESEDDLARIAKAPGASGIETIDEPGGGKRVRLTEPNGYQVEVVHGIATLAPIPLKPRQKLNSGEDPLARAGELMRLPKGPSQVKRIGHGVLNTPKFGETVAWFRETLGFICSDDVYAGDKSNLIGSFNRLDRGEDFVDHHVFFCLRAREDRAEPPLVRGAGHRRRRDGPQLSQAVRHLRAHVGDRPASARQPGLRLLGRSVGPRARALGRLATASTSRTARTCCRPRRRWCRNGARGRRRNSSITRAREDASLGVASSMARPRLPMTIG